MIAIKQIPTGCKPVGISGILLCSQCHTSNGDGGLFHGHKKQEHPQRGAPVLRNLLGQRSSDNGHGVVPHRLTACGGPQGIESARGK